MGFDYDKLRTLQEMLSKEAQFVPPDAMGGGAPPMDPAMMGGDPAAMGGGMPPVDPAMAGGDPAAMGGIPPVDPSMMGGDPAAMGGMPPMDPAMAGGGAADPGDVSPTGEPYIKMTPSQISKFIKQLTDTFKSILGLGGQQAPQPAAQQPQQTDPALIQKMTELDAKMNAILGMGA